MKKLPEAFLFRLLEQNPLTILFQSCTQLKAHDRFYSCCCPFHADRYYTCQIENDSFYCPVCHKGGDAFTFVMLTQNCSYPEAVSILAERCGMTVPQEMDVNHIRQAREHCFAINRDAANFYYHCLLRGSDRRGLKYLAGRKLFPQTVRKYGLGFAPDNWHMLKDYLLSKGYSEQDLLLANICRKNEKGHVYDNFRNRVIFPIVGLDGNVTGFGGRVLDDSKPKYLNTGDTPVFDKGSQLFSLHFARKAAPSAMILAEGYMDVIALHQAGFENTVATLGTAITSEQARLLKQYASEVIIAYDSDTAGQNATLKALHQFQAAGLPARVLHMTGAKDPDEFIQKFSAYHFRQLMEQAEDATSFRLNRCRNGLDLTSETGRTAFLRRCVPILADISNLHRREDLIRILSHELDIRPEVLSRQTENFKQKQNRTQIRTEFRMIAADFYQADPVNPSAVRQPKANESERLLLAYLMRRPETCTSLMKRILPEDFITEFHQKLYSLLIHIIPETAKFHLSLLGSFLTPEEMGYITGILYQFRNIALEDAAAEECIQNLHEIRNQPEQKQADDSLRKAFADKQKKSVIHLKS